MNTTTFNHSVKVPKLYKCAAKISREVAGGVGSIKHLIYEKKHFNTKALYALVATTFQRANEIDLLLKRTKLLEKETRLDPWLARVLISELLWGKKKLPESEAKPILTILAYRQSFFAHLSDSSRDNNSENMTVARKPRYVRINTLITSTNEALELFQEEGWLLVSPHAKTYREFLEQVTTLEGNYFLKDFHVPDLLIFPAGTEFYNHPGYKKGSLILQDKASCLPVHVLSPLPGSVVLDMCAAPGMKTTQLAAVLKDSKTLYAVEMDPKRFDILKKMVDSSGATCVQLFNEDVLQCDSSNFPNVEYILVDPSCSGSGMTDRLEPYTRPDSARLEKLAGFQIKILRHALTKFPNAKKVVYSTCSLEPEENEDVVRQVLETNGSFKLVPATHFLDKEWINFGSPEFGDIGTSCLYTKPEHDLTNGFFLAVFERLEDGESNKFYNKRVMNYRKNMDQKKQSKKDRKNNVFDKKRKYENDLGTDEAESQSKMDQKLTEDEDNIKSKKLKKQKNQNNKIAEEPEISETIANDFEMDQQPTRKSKKKDRISKNEDIEDDKTIQNKLEKKKHKRNSDIELKDSKERKKKKKLKNVVEEV